MCIRVHPLRFLMSLQHWRIFDFSSYRGMGRNNEEKKQRLLHMSTSSIHPRTNRKRRSKNSIPTPPSHQIPNHDEHPRPSSPPPIKQNSTQKPTPTSTNPYRQILDHHVYTILYHVMLCAMYDKNHDV